MTATAPHHVSLDMDVEETGLVEMRKSLAEPALLI